jgi:hypothetical protein
MHACNNNNYYNNNNNHHHQGALKKLSQQRLWLGLGLQVDQILGNVKRIVNE